MKLHDFDLKFNMKAESMLNITGNIQNEIDKIGAIDGFVVLFAKGSTAALTTIEYESGLVKDFNEMMEIVAPRGKDYAHHMKWHDDNGRSHLRSSLIGSSLTITITNGNLDVGAWQQIVIINFDTRDRERKIIGKIIYK